MLAIKNFGILWERKHIYWGYSGKAGHLKGYISNNVIVDFRYQRGVYVLYDKDMIPVYVGCQRSFKSEPISVVRIEPHSIFY